jgi:hypothetical protein
LKRIYFATFRRLEVQKFRVPCSWLRHKPFNSFLAPRNFHLKLTFRVRVITLGAKYQPHAAATDSPGLDLNEARRQKKQCPYMSTNASHVVKR